MESKTMKQEVFQLKKPSQLLKNILTHTENLPAKYNNVTKHLSYTWHKSDI
jgi:hypothetical protein